MKPVEEHLAECLAAVQVLPPAWLAPLDALDCVLAEDVVSAVDLPSFDNSSMDGYAVTIPDVAAVGEGRPVTLPVTADIPAGSTGRQRISPGTTARIMTGAPVPAGADAVVPVEWTDGGADRVEIRQAPSAGQYVRTAGDDVRAGQTVLTAGTRLSPRHVGLLAAVGRSRVLVRPRPRVVVISTGSELMEPGRPLGHGQVYDSNGYALAAAALEVGAIARHVGIVADDARELLALLEDQLTRADLIVTSGGVSAGAYDTVKEVLSQLGTVRFDKVAMQPGMPQGFGTVGPGGTPIFTLPGNPVSSMVSFEVFVRPVIRKMWGESGLHRHSLVAEATQDWRSPEGKRQFVRARLERRQDGVALVTPIGGQGSHLVADLAEATCLAVVPEDVTQVRTGDSLRCLLLDRGRR
ncbi:MAG TPA: gephyrin-like molybdotransferase Glp [Kineosporiaceae bacterium]|nr:gephyrin-like molybdotransferase Glp [Kineosporiaceae bacterium]